MMFSWLLTAQSSPCDWCLHTFPLLFYRLNLTLYCTQLWDSNQGWCNLRNKNFCKRDKKNPSRSMLTHGRALQITQPRGDMQSGRALRCLKPLTRQSSGLKGRWELLPSKIILFLFSPSVRDCCWRVVLPHIWGNASPETITHQNTKTHAHKQIQKNDQEQLSEINMK